MLVTFSKEKQNKKTKLTLMKTTSDLLASSVLSNKLSLGLLLPTSLYEYILTS